jgi:hypothetical protein
MKKYKSGGLSWIRRELCLNLRRNETGSAGRLHYWTDRRANVVRAQRASVLRRQRREARLPQQLEHQESAATLPLKAESAYPI